MIAHEIPQEVGDDALRRAPIAVRHFEDPAVCGHDDWRARARHYLSLAIQPS